MQGSLDIRRRILCQSVARQVGPGHGVFHHWNDPWHWMYMGVDSLRLWQESK